MLRDIIHLFMCNHISGKSVFEKDISLAINWKHLLVCLTVLTLSMWMARTANAGMGERTVLALYDSRTEATPDRTRIHNLAELPLNHMADGPDGNHTADFFALFDLRNDGFVPITHQARIAKLNQALYEYEHPLDPVLRPFPLLSRLSPEIDPHLVIETTFDGRPYQSTIVSTGPKGGFVPLDYVFFEEGELDVDTQGRVKWMLNPFAFFEQAFGRSDAPVPDVTTRAGRRIVISHVDGDGWNNLTEIDDPDQRRPRRATEVILDEIIRPNPDLAVTVGLIGGDADLNIEGDEEARWLARELFALKHVEIASHGYSHPFVWRYFERYDRGDELALWDQARQTEGTPPAARMGAWLAQMLNLERYIRKDHHDYVSVSADLPRAYARYPFSLDREIAGSLAFAAEFAPPGKTARIFLWTGDAEPFAEAIRATRQAGVINLNGGMQNRFDANWPSISYLSPNLRVVDGAV